MDTMTDARREAGLELQALAREFEASDEAAFRRTRILCWVVLGIAALIEALLLISGGDWRYLLGSWLLVAAVTWGAYALSTGRQRRQTARLRDLALRWVGVDPPVV